MEKEEIKKELMSIIGYFAVYGDDKNSPDSYIMMMLKLIRLYSKIS